MIGFVISIFIDCCATIGHDIDHALQNIGNNALHAVIIDKKSDELINFDLFEMYMVLIINVIYFYN